VIRRFSSGPGVATSTTKTDIKHARPGIELTAQNGIGWGEDGIAQGHWADRAGEEKTNRRDAPGEDRTTRPTAAGQ